MAEKEYIRKVDVVNHLHEIQKNKFADSDYKKFAWAMEIFIDGLSTADVQPVVHAHWICIGDYDEFIFECSNCHDIWRFENGTPHENNVDYCFSCGAKMDGDDTYD